VPSSSIYMYIHIYIYRQQCMHVDRIMIMQAGMHAVLQFMFMSAFCASSCLEALVFFSLPVCHGIHE